MMALCGFCLDEPGPCAHPDCPFGATDALVSEAGHPERPATRPSIIGGPAAAVVPVPVAAPAARSPHIATAPSLASPTERRREP